MLKILPKSRAASARSGTRLAGRARIHHYPRQAERRKYAFWSAGLTFLKRLFAAGRQSRAPNPLYRAAVAAARDPVWYRQGAVPDTLDGRFDMMAAVLALVLLRLEGAGARDGSVRLTEAFIDDMDGELRQIGIGDFVVGKHVGGMVGALGGRLGAFRAVFAGGGDLGEAVRRNVFRGSPPGEEAVAWVAGRLRDFHARLDQADIASLLAGELPKP